MAQKAQKSELGLSDAGHLRKDQTKRVPQFSLQVRFVPAWHKNGPQVEFTFTFSAKVKGTTGAIQSF